VEDVDKEDIKRYYEFVDQKVADLLLVAQPTAKANDRIAVEPRDLPITKGLQESIHAFEALDLDIGLERILEKTVPEPQMDLPYSAETGARLPAIVGGLSLALARTFKIIDPQLKDLEHKNGSARFESSSCCCRNLGGTAYCISSGTHSPAAIRSRSGGITM
jgi:hypothetical protein